MIAAKSLRWPRNKEVLSLFGVMNGSMKNLIPSPFELHVL
jgi:hypothetical protein